MTEGVLTFGFTLAEILKLNFKHVGLYGTVALISVRSSCAYHNEPGHEISNNVVCATSKASDQPAHMRSLIRAFASRLNIL